PPPPQRSTLSLHDALPILRRHRLVAPFLEHQQGLPPPPRVLVLEQLDQVGAAALGHIANLGLRRALVDYLVNPAMRAVPHSGIRSEEHTSELQSPDHLVCR